MKHMVYAGLLAACVIGTLPLEFFFRARVYRRIRPAALAILPVAAVFIGWDYLATAAGWWHFDPHYVIGVMVGSLPLEELLFFLVIPLCGLLTFEAVRWIKPHWAGPAELADDRATDDQP